MDAHTVEIYKGYTIKIYYDDDPNESPRDWDNLGIMACWHRRSWLGDNPEEVQRYSPIGWMIHELIYNYEAEIYKEIKSEDTYAEDWLMEDDERVRKMWDKFYVTLPIYTYEHGGITISTGRFSDPWDSGQLGFIYVSKEECMEEWKVKRWTKKFEKKIISLLEGEIETYDQYLTGDVHGYMIYAPDDEDCENCLDSCWGFYGSDYCMEEAKSIVDWYVENKMNKGLELSQTLPVGAE